MDIGIRDLKNNLSRHLKSVREGNAITVTDHGKPIARIEPIVKVSKLDQLIAEGRVTPAMEPKGELPKPIKAEGSILEFLEEQRG
jgi:prevent-host-death family protein